MEPLSALIPNALYVCSSYKMLDSLPIAGTKDIRIMNVHISLSVCLQMLCLSACTLAV